VNSLRPSPPAALALLALLAGALPLAACPEPAPRPRAPAGAAPAPGTVPAMPPEVTSVSRPQGREWFGIYVAGKKAGWMVQELRTEREGGKEQLVAVQETVLQVSVGGKKIERRQSEERRYEARPGGRLVRVRAEWAGDGGHRVIEGSCVSASCRLAITAADGSRSERTLEEVAETAETADAVRIVAARRAPLAGPALDLDQLRVRPMRHAFLRREATVAGGVPLEVSVVSEQEEGDRIAVEARVADDGRILEIKVGEALVARAEPEATAKRLDAVDLFLVSRVALPRPLPRDVPARITFRFAKLPPAFQVSDARQRFGPGPGGSVALTVAAAVPAAADPRRDAPFPEAPAKGDPDLEPTPQFDSDAPPIVALARELTAGAKGSYEAAVRLEKHVFGRLKKSYGTSNDRASDVLVAGRGDCTEHTALFVALARAAGIPARAVHGLVFAAYSDAAPALYWHAWPEVRVAGAWIPLDPTFGQPVADATHVALGGGARVDTVGLLGSLKVLSVDVGR
jgi:transglutaminase-like putative cysteine protease